MVFRVVMVMAMMIVANGGSSHGEMNTVVVPNVPAMAWLM